MMNEAEGIIFLVILLNPLLQYIMYYIENSVV